MIFSLFRRKPPDPADALYVAIVAQARQPGFYLDHAVPDTVEGRFEMILVHLAVFFDRMKGEAPEAGAVAQRVVDTFFLDMDRSLREMGIGDISVPKKMKKLGDAFNGRMLAYTAALADGQSEALTAAIARNVLTTPDLAAAGRIAGYLLDSAARLKAAPVADLIAAQLPFAPVPAPPAADPEGSTP